MSGNSSSSDAGKPEAAPASFRPQERVQIQPEMPFIPYAGPGRALYPQAFNGMPDRRKRQGRWHEYGVLVGLWLLVILVAAVVIVRFLDLSEGTVRPVDYRHAGVSPAIRDSRAAPATSAIAAEDDPFDDPLPSLPPVAEVSRATAPTPMPEVSTSASLRASGSMSGTPRAAPACQPALAAMQLCGAAGK